MEKEDWSKQRAEYDDLAASCFQKHRYAEALRWYRLSAAFIEEHICESRGFVNLELPAAFDQMAKAYHFMCEYEYAVKYYAQSLRYNRILDRVERIVDQHVAIANCW